MITYNNSLLPNFALMMRPLYIILLTVFVISCGKSEDEKAAKLMSQIDSLYVNEMYNETLDSIVSLRSKYPKAVSSRKKALDIWRKASLKLAQSDIAKTDSALQATIKAIDGETNLYKANMLRAKKDSLQSRYEAMCGVVRMIKTKQSEK